MGDGTNLAGDLSWGVNMTDEAVMPFCLALNARITENMSESALLFILGTILAILWLNIKNKDYGIR